MSQIVVRTRTHNGEQAQILLEPFDSVHVICTLTKLGETISFPIGVTSLLHQMEKHSLADRATLANLKTQLDKLVGASV